MFRTHCFIYLFLDNFTGTNKIESVISTWAEKQISPAHVAALLPFVSWRSNPCSPNNPPNNIKIAEIQSNQVP